MTTTTSGFSFSLPPEEALKFFRAKGLKTSFAWQDMVHEEHSRAFTVAKMMDMDMLADVRAVVDAALAEGWSFYKFKENLVPYLADKGWWGVKDMLDPLTGEIKTVQLGSPRRLKTIFDTNMSTAYAAGKWTAIQQTAKSAPYLMYDAVNDGRTRPQHRAWDGTVLLVNDPWWDTHYPPNGWNCRCSVIQLDKRQLERLRKTGPSSVPDSPTREWTNPRTGELLSVPAGIDPGWGYNPGAERGGDILKAFAEKLQSSPPDQAMRTLTGYVASGEFTDWVEKPLWNLPVMRIPGEVSAAIGAKISVASLSPESAGKNYMAHWELSTDDYKQLPMMGHAPAAVIQDSQTSSVLVRTGGDGKTYLAVVKATETGYGLFVTSFRKTKQADMERLLRKGKLIYGSLGNL
ncbi:minor capsid protein [candidate division KSB1 bacterium]|nr:minor capsid protein [candidate division KSB1 bacterium]